MRRSWTDGAAERRRLARGSASVACACSLAAAWDVFDGGRGRHASPCRALPCRPPAMCTSGGRQSRGPALPSGAGCRLLFWLQCRWTDICRVSRDIKQPHRPEPYAGEPRPRCTDSHIRMSSCCTCAPQGMRALGPVVWHAGRHGQTRRRAPSRCACSPARRARSIAHHGALARARPRRRSLMRAAHTAKSRSCKRVLRGEGRAGTAWAPWRPLCRVARCGAPAGPRLVAGGQEERRKRVKTECAGSPAAARRRGRAWSLAARLAATPSAPPARRASSHHVVCTVHAGAPSRPGAGSTVLASSQGP